MNDELQKRNVHITCKLNSKNKWFNTCSLNFVVFKVSFFIYSCSVYFGVVFKVGSNLFFPWLGDKITCNL